MTNSPLLTIITASFNSEKTIENTLKSVLNQTVKGVEYIVVDGGSNDETVSILKKYEVSFEEKGISFKWISEKDSGIYNAWNKGLKLATGDWISFLGSDDIYLQEALVVYREKIIENNEADFVTAKAKMVRDGAVVREFGEEWSWNTFQREMKILHSGSFLNCKYINAFGAFDESYRITGDYELLLRKRDRLKVVFINQFLVEMGADGVSSDEVWKALKEAKRARVTTGKVNRIVGAFQMYFVYLKIALKQLLS